MSNDKMTNDIFSDWHLRKEITIGQIITMVTVIVSLFAWGSSVEQRIEVNSREYIRIEQKLDLSQAAMVNRMDRTDATISSSLSDIKKSLMRIEDRINNDRP